MAATRRRWVSRTRSCMPGAAALAALAILAMTAAPHGTAEEASAVGTIVIDGLMWAVRSNGQNVEWEPANAYCENLELAGYTDWRLPTLEELESVHDPNDAENGFIRRPLVLEDCCLWSSSSLADVSAEDVGERGGQGGPASNYFWGFLYAAGIRYYSITIFDDGQAHCVRDP
jgi:hypothetical protein